MGSLKSIAVNVHAQHCFEGEEEQMPCCKDISQELKVEEVTTVGFDFDASPELYELAIINYVLSNAIDLGLAFEKQPSHLYSPPLPDRDITVLIQSFLI